MIVCQCTATTDRDIERLRDQGTDTVAAIAAATGAGRNCAPCRREIMDLLDTRTTTAAGPNEIAQGEKAHREIARDGKTDGKSADCEKAA